MRDPILLTLAILLAVGLYVWTAASLHAVLRKAGEPGWQAWVPVLNTIVLLRLGGFSAWWILLALVPVVGIALFVILVIAYHRISVAFGFGAGMTVLAALLFPVWTSVLGWGSARWLGSPVHAPGHGPVRRGQPLDARLDGGEPSIYGSYAPAPTPLPTAPVDSSDVPRPAAPAAAAPAPDAAPDPAAPVAPEPVSAPHAALDWWTDAEASGDAPAAERPRAPYTGSIPLPRPESPEPVTVRSAPRQAVVPGETPETEEADAAAPRAAAAGAFAPLAAAPPVASAPPPPVAAVDPWAPPAPVTTPIPAAATRALRSAPPAFDGDGMFDTSGEVSAVAGAPTLGVPKAALASVSAVQRGSAFPEPEEEYEETVLAFRRRATWTLTRPLGVPVTVAGDVMIIGRRPSPDPDFPQAQLVPVSDETRTISKTHARLELDGGTWFVVDLDSTNGVVIVMEDGTEVDVTPGAREPLVERFFLGDAELRITKDTLDS